MRLLSPSPCDTDETVRNTMLADAMRDDTMIDTHKVSCFLQNNKFVLFLPPFLLVLYFTTLMLYSVNIGKANQVFIILYFCKFNHIKMLMKHKKVFMNLMADTIIL